MEKARDILRSGAWLTRERTRLVAAAVLALSMAGFVILVATAHGGVDFKGRPLGTDFSDVYAAGTYTLEGHPAAPFDPARQHAREQQIFGTGTPFYGWHYPPFSLFVAAALALMPYGAALAVWQTVTLGFYLLTVRAIISPSILSAPGSRRRESPDEEVRNKIDRSRDPAPSGLQPSGFSPSRRHEWLLLAVAFPAVLINVGHGQNGFLTAALLGAALVTLDRAPLVAGVLFGLLAYKPQFGLTIPIALAASGRWRCFVAAAAAVVVLVAATVLAFGPHVWPAFWHSTRFTRLVALEQGNTGWYKIQSVFAWARMWGASIPVAYVLQGALDAALVAALAGLWRSAAAYPLKAAALCLAAMLATPYAFDYDMMMLGPAIAFFAADGFARGFGPWEKTALAALWLTPLFARSIAHLTLIPLGVPAMLMIFILLLRRSARDLAWPMAFSSAFLPK